MSVQFDRDGVTFDIVEVSTSWPQSQGAPESDNPSSVCYRADDSDEERISALGEALKLVHHADRSARRQIVVARLYKVQWYNWLLKEIQRRRDRSDSPGPPH